MYRAACEDHVLLFVKWIVVTPLDSLEEHTRHEMFHVPDISTVSHACYWQIDVKRKLAGIWVTIMSLHMSIMNTLGHQNFTSQELIIYFLNYI